MSEGKSEAKPLDLPPDLRAQRDEFVQTFFRRGVELTEHLIEEHEVLSRRLKEAERENERLRALAAKAGVDPDEAGKTALEANAPPERYGVLEEELSMLANVYVAGQQLLSSLDLPTILRHMRELLNQLVGSHSFGVYLLDERREKLLPLTGEGLVAPWSTPIALKDAPTNPIVGALEKAALAGIQHVAEDPHDARQIVPACIPMRFGASLVGVIVVYAVLPQKLTFMPVDHELFRLLSTQGTTVLFTSQLLADAGRLPSVEAILQRAAQKPRTVG